MNLSEQQCLLIIARHEWPDEMWEPNCLPHPVTRCVRVKTNKAAPWYCVLDHNTIEPIWNEWLDRVVLHFVKQSEDLIKPNKLNNDDVRLWARANTLDDLLQLRTPLQKANALIEYWLAVGEIKDEDLKC